MRILNDRPAGASSGSQNGEGYVRPRSVESLMRVNKTRRAGENDQDLMPYAWPKDDQPPEDDGSSEDHEFTDEVIVGSRRGYHSEYRETEPGSMGGFGTRNHIGRSTGIRIPSTLPLSNCIARRRFRTHNCTFLPRNHSHHTETTLNHGSLF